jgi:hypothetical protein
VAFVSDVVSSFDSNSTGHLFLASDYSHLSLVARSNPRIIDSGASEHMTGDESRFFDTEALDSIVRIASAGNGTLEAPLIGSTPLLSKRKGKVTLGKVMFVRGLGFNLTSVPGLTPLGADFGSPRLILTVQGQSNPACGRKLPCQAPRAGEPL